MKLAQIRRRDRAGVTRRAALQAIAGGVTALAAASCYREPGDAVEADADATDDRPETRHGPRGELKRYATALSLDGFATGVIAQCRGGWPVKLDGNPAHPASRGGGSSAITQARLLDLYDPQRVGGAAWAPIAQRLAGERTPLWLVMPPQTSPTVAALLAKIAARRELHVVWHAPIDHGAAYAGAALAFGRAVETQYAIEQAAVIAALDADWLAAMPMATAWASAMAPGRAPTAAMSRLWACEPMPTPTGTLADERLALRAGDVVWIAVVVAAKLGAVAGLPAPVVTAARARLDDACVTWAERLAADLAAHRGRGAIIVGDRQPPVVHALARAIDAVCGNVGATVTYSEPARLDPRPELAGRSFAELAAAARGGARVIVVDANPVATAPRSLGLADALAAADATAITLFPDETAAACRERVALAHELEAWCDPRAWDGTIAIAQPVVRPRFDVVSVIDALAAIAGEPRTARALIRETGGFATATAIAGDSWRQALATGVIDGSANANRALALASTADAAIAAALTHAVATPRPAYELALAPSPQVHDGRFASNGWLQELPHPITKQMWGNAALIGPATAAALDVQPGDSLEVSTAAGRCALPAVVVAGHAERAVTIELGYGRTAPALPVCVAIGGDGYALRAGDSLIADAKVAPGGRAAATATAPILAQLTLDAHDRDPAPSATRDQLSDNPDLTAHLRGPLPTMLPATPSQGLQWAMSIDTSLCTGCQSCVVACVAENNTPVVGPEHAARGRRMQWLRIDSYCDPDLREGARYVHQPVPCMHCEHAPCEYVCPVGATTHSHDGLNEQVYNRCIGTRFCSNNCPYKVRRFNWFAFDEPVTSRALQFNPEVTVRSRGVMEKCTYCVQRIRDAEHVALVEHREIGAGEVVTACQQACPTGAIAFGALSHAGPLALRRRDPRRYELLHHLGTRPRTQHLLRIRNPAGDA